MRLLYITAGTHGAGHVVRGIALQRALQRARAVNPDVDVTLTIAAPPSPFLHLVGDAGVTVTVDTAVLRDPRTAKDSDVARVIAAAKPDLIIIDVFWVPLTFVPLPCPAWLLLRSVPPAWLVGPKEARFDAGRYERVIAIEPASGLERFEAIPPVVVATVDDVADDPRAALARHLGVDREAPLRVISRGGLPDDKAPLTAAAARVYPGRWYEFDLQEPAAPFPGAPLLAGADAVVAGAGYNTFWEARLLGFDARTTWVPLKRVIDDQHWRAALPTSVRYAANGADVLAQQVIDRAR